MKIENKVAGATSGALASTVVANFVVYLLATLLFQAPVPPEVVGFVNTAVAAAGAFVGGYVARHTSRNDAK